jgi:hypothetical protein
MTVRVITCLPICRSDLKWQSQGSDGGVRIILLALLKPILFFQDTGGLDTHI